MPTTTCHTRLRPYNDDGVPPRHHRILFSPIASPPHTDSTRAYAPSSPSNRIHPHYSSNASTASSHTLRASRRLPPPLRHRESRLFLLQLHQRVLVTELRNIARHSYTMQLTTSSRAARRNTSIYSPASSPPTHPTPSLGCAEAIRRIAFSLGFLILP